MSSNNIAHNLITLRSKLPEGVSLVAVSKFHPAAAIMEAYAAGQRVFAESRPQELAAKVPKLPQDISWHFIGHLQTNKIKLVLPYVDLVQSVDSFHLLEAIDKWGREYGKLINVLLELHLGAESTKQGFSADEILSIASGADALSPTSFASLRPLPSSMGPSLLHGRAGSPEISQFLGCSGWPWVGDSASAPKAGANVIGLMGMATNTDDMEVVEKDFERIEELFRKCQAINPAFTQLSIGMSTDWPHAVKHGATMVRIGTDIFGPREY